MEKASALQDKRYITVLSVFSALAVVLLHSNGCFWSFSYERYWLTANIIESVFYFAVPVFFMISGANLIDYNERYDTKQYFVKRIEKTVIPFIAWSLLGLAYQLHYNAIDSAVIGKRWLVDSIFNTSIIGIYWYFIPQFAIYFIIPFIACIEKDKRQNIFKYAILCLILFYSAFPLLFDILDLKYNYAMQIGGGYTIYVLSGYYINKYPIKKKIRYIIYIFAVVGLAFHIIGTWKLSYNAGGIVDTYKGYTNLPCVAYSIGIYMLFKYLNETKFMDKLYNIAAWFSGTTFGIYLVHWYLLDQILRKMTFLTSTSIIYRIPAGILVFVAASIMTRILQKIPIVKKIVPA